jgi:hypothetical protein
MDRWIIRDRKVQQALRHEWSISDYNLRNTVQFQAERYTLLRRQSEEARQARAAAQALQFWPRWLRSPLIQRFLRPRSV